MTLSVTIRKPEHAKFIDEMAEAGQISRGEVLERILAVCFKTGTIDRLRAIIIDFDNSMAKVAEEFETKSAAVELFPVPKPMGFPVDTSIGKGPVMAKARKPTAKKPKAAKAAKEVKAEAANSHETVA
jgi:hypothetical protein